MRVNKHSKVRVHRRIEAEVTPSGNGRMWLEPHEEYVVARTNQMYTYLHTDFGLEVRVRSRDMTMLDFRIIEEPDIVVARRMFDAGDLPPVDEAA